MIKNKWMSKSKWDSLVKGEDCPLCEAIVSKTKQNRFGTTIINLKTGKLRLIKNQYVPGYCVFISKKHVKEAYHLDKESRQSFFEDVMTSCNAIEKVFLPIKMNITILGNKIPHLHVHIIPRYYNDDAPDEPIDPTKKSILISKQKEKEIAEKIRGFINQ